MGFAVERGSTPEIPKEPNFVKYCDKIWRTQDFTRARSSAG